MDFMQSYTGISLVVTSLLIAYMVGYTIYSISKAIKDKIYEAILDSLKQSLLSQYRVDLKALENKLKYKIERSEQVLRGDLGVAYQQATDNKLAIDEIAKTVQEHELSKLQMFDKLGANIKETKRIGDAMVQVEENYLNDINKVYEQIEYKHQESLQYTRNHATSLGKTTDKCIKDLDERLDATIENFNNANQRVYNKAEEANQRADDALIKATKRYGVNYG